VVRSYLGICLVGTNCRLFDGTELGAPKKGIEFVTGLIL
jgi:hypothetical protein